MPKLKDQKNSEALERTEKQNKLTAKQQLEKLDGMFGKDKGAKKERCKLAILLAETKPEKKVPEKKEYKVKKGEDPLKAKKAARKEARNQ